MWLLVVVCGMTSFSTQIVIDDDELMEYEVNPRRMMLHPSNENQNKRQRFWIHDTVRPSPTTLVIGSRQPSVVQPVGVEDSLNAPDSSLIFILFQVIPIKSSFYIWFLLHTETPKPSKTICH